MAGATAAEDLVWAAFADLDGLTVVDRSRLHTALAELELGGTGAPGTNNLQLGALLNATHLISGHWSCEAGSFALLLRLVEAESSQVLWEKMIEGRTAEIARTILATRTELVAALGRQLPASTTSRLFQQQSEAFELCRQASGANPSQALELYKNALLFTPEFPTALTGIARCLYAQWHDKQAPAAALTEAIDCCRKSIAFSAPGNQVDAAILLTKVAMAAEKTAVATEAVQIASTDLSRAQLLEMKRKLDHRTVALLATKLGDMELAYNNWLSAITRQGTTENVPLASLIGDSFRPDQVPLEYDSLLELMKLYPTLSAAAKTTMLQTVTENLDTVLPYHAQRAIRRLDPAETDASLLLRNGEISLFVLLQPHQALPTLQKALDKCTTAAVRTRATDALAAAWLLAGNYAKAVEALQQLTEIPTFDPARRAEILRRLELAGMLAANNAAQARAASLAELEAAASSAMQLLQPSLTVLTRHYLLFHELPPLPTKLALKLRMHYHRDRLKQMEAVPLEQIAVAKLAILQGVPSTELWKSDTPVQDKVYAEVSGWRLPNFSIPSLRRFSMRIPHMVFGQHSPVMVIGAETNLYGFSPQQTSPIWMRHVATQFLLHRRSLRPSIDFLGSVAIGARQACLVYSRPNSTLLCLDLATGNQLWAWANWEGHYPKLQLDNDTITVTFGSPEHILRLSLVTGNIASDQATNDNAKTPVASRRFNMLRFCPAASVDDLRLVCTVPLLANADSFVYFGRDNIFWIKDNILWHGPRNLMKRIAEGTAGRAAASPAKPPAALLNRSTAPPQISRRGMPPTMSRRPSGLHGSRAGVKPVTDDEFKWLSGPAAVRLLQALLSQQHGSHPTQQQAIAQVFGPMAAYQSLKQTVFFTPKHSKGRDCAATVFAYDAFTTRPEDPAAIVRALQHYPDEELAPLFQYVSALSLHADPQVGATARTVRQKLGK